MEPYSLVVIWKDGRTTVQAKGHNPTAVREAEAQVSRNTKLIQRIELRDLTGPLEAVWDADWDLGRK